MNLRQKLYQMFILGTSGEGYEKALQNGLGGIIFFTPDIQSAEQFKNLTQKCKDLAIIPPFLSIDQEGGRVERTENIHKGKKYLSAKYAFEKDFAKHISSYQDGLYLLSDINQEYNLIKKDMSAYFKNYLKNKCQTKPSFEVENAKDLYFVGNKTSASQLEKYFLCWVFDC